jgi:hypothetical protein
MPARLIAWLDEAARWGPALAVAIVFAVALIEAVMLPRRVWAKGAWILVVAACGGLAGGDLQWQKQGRQQQEQGRHRAESNEIAALHGLWDQWDRVSETLPAAGEHPAASFDTTDDALASLSAQVSGIGRQIAALQEQPRGRSIDGETATKLVDYLRQYGSYPAVVSCVPDDVEAYNYATQMVNILRAAGWDAHGPEITAVLASAMAMGVTVVVRDQHAPEAAKILLDALARFNVPYQSGIAESEAILDTATVELFVAKKP